MKLSNLLPKRLEMSDLVPGEKIIMIVKRHVFYFLKKINLILILSVIIWSIFIFLYAKLEFIPVDYRGVSKMILLVGFGLVNLIVCFRLLYLWIDYNFDNLVLTSQRIIFVDQHFIYGKTLREIELTKITTVTYENNSFMANLIGYSRLMIDSADDGKHITFDYTPKVEQVRAMIAQATQRMFEQRYTPNNFDYQKTSQENNLVVPKEDKEVDSFDSLKNQIAALKNEYDFLRQKVNLLEEEIFKLKNNNN